MIANKVLFVPWILLHPLVILDALEDDLAEAIEWSDITHLLIKEL